MPGISPDLQSALRGLARHRSVAVVSVACLALGVGTSATMLGLLDLLLFRPPAHVKSPDAVQRVYLVDTFPGYGEVVSSTTSYPVYQDLRKGVRSLTALGAYSSTDVAMGRGEAARKARAVLVTPDFLPMLGVSPVRGRLFSESEGQPGRAGSVVLLSEELWRHGFGGAADVLGKLVVVDGDVYTIVGVLPRGFAGVDLEGAELWLPISSADRSVGPKWPAGRGVKFLEIVGRLRGGVSAAAAAQEATAVFRAAALEAGKPKPEVRVTLGPVQRARGPEAPSAVRVSKWLTGISWLVLLIACANVAGLLLLRNLDRRRDLALRLALGASAGQVGRLVLYEAALLGLLGGIGALGVLFVLGSSLERLLLPDAVVPVAAPDLRTLGIVAGLATLAALLCGLVPALWARRHDLMAPIRSGGRESGPAQSRLSSALVAGQIGLTLALLTGAGAFVRSLANVLHLDLGLDAERVLVVTLAASDWPAARVDQVFRQALERVKKLPGVERASLAATIPFESSVAGHLALPGGQPIPELSTGGPYVNAVSEDFFSTLGTAVRQGRPFTATDRAGSAPVVVVNDTMAKTLWPDQSAVGQCMLIGGEKEPCATVVGVVADARRSELQEELTLQYYVPLGQAAEKLSSRALFVRAENPDLLSGPARREVEAVARDLPYVEVRKLADLLDPQLHPWRLGSGVLSLFGGFALVLALVGLYGVLAHSMARRTHELGVRMALGAQGRHLRWLAIRQGLLLALIGGVIGLVLCLVARRFLQPLLFHVSAVDPEILLPMTALVFLFAVTVSDLASRRARRVDPTEALRMEV